MENVLIRQAAPADGPVVREFVFATLRSYGIEPDPTGLDADVVSFGTAGDGPVLELVAEVDGTVVGAVVISALGNGEATLSKFFVDTTKRGQGLGRALLARGVAEARACGYRLLHLETRAAFLQAVHLYEATGWVRGPDLPSGHGPERSYSLTLE